MVKPPLLDQVTSQLWVDAADVLLPDIGHMGVPDIILRKPDLLTEEERAVMAQHPEYAYETLAPIVFLRPAGRRARKMEYNSRSVCPPGPKSMIKALGEVAG